MVKDRVTGVALPDYLILPDQTGYWQFGDDSIIETGAGDLGTAFDLEAQE